PTTMTGRSRSRAPALGSPTTARASPGPRAWRARIAAAAAPRRVGRARWARSAPSARTQARVEDEVEDVHDQVGDDHADREHDEDRLRERVVVAQHRGLQRVAGAGVAEDVLDEHEAADRAREQRG